MNQQAVSLFILPIQLEPLKAENERVTKENNTLHMDIIAAKEAVDKTELSLKGQLRTLQNENQDLRFVVDQKDIKTAKDAKEITEDDVKDFETQLQKMVDEANKNIDAHLKKKEEDISEE